MDIHAYEMKQVIDINIDILVYFILQQLLEIMSQFDFDFDHKPNTNMEEIMDKVDNFSGDWDNFQSHNPNNSGSMSNSEIFNKSKKSESQKSQRKDFQDSRDIMQISMFGTQNNDRSFRFQKDDHRDFPKPNQRYSKLQQLLEVAKKNSLDQFYKNIERENKAYNDEPDKFANYKEFKDYIKDIKANKRQDQNRFAEKYAANPFATINSNKIYETVGSNKMQKDPQKRGEIEQQPQYNFSKKQGQSQNSNNPFDSGHLLPKQYEKQDFFQDQPKQDQRVINPAKKFNNFYEGQKLPERAAQHNKQEDAFQFFEANPKKTTDRSQKQQKVVLQPIREQKHNSFERTFEQQKLDNLFKNYQSMRKNFEELMGQLKSTNEGQQKLVTQLRKLKEQRVENQAKEQRQARRQRKQRQKIEKDRKLDTIRDEITKIKSNEKDILFSQINKKIQQLQYVVRSALQQINEEKQAKIVPKVTNYFCEHQKRFENIDQQFEKGLQEFDPEAYKEPKQQYYDENNQSQQKSMQMFTQNQNKNLQVSSRKNLMDNPSQKNIRAEKNSNHKQSQSKSKSRSQFQQSRQQSMGGSRARDLSHQNLYSPLDLQLQGNVSGELSYSMAQDDFSPPEFAEEFFPRQLQSGNKNLRNCLIQKSSVVFQSFDFHVSARFSVVEDQMHPIVAAMRIGNKCSIDLYDVHVITYGPQGPGISTDPSTIFQQQVKRNSSFAFQVSLDKTCLQDNGFSIQIWYKTDSMPKKKINFKVPLPMLQLIRPQFIYEQKFVNDWQNLTNEQFLRPKRLDSTYLRSHEDLKLILPFIEISDQNHDSFSYGLAFRYPKCENIFYLKITCFVSGRALIQLRSQKNGDKKLKEQILNVLNFIFYSPL